MQLFSAEATLFMKKKKIWQPKVKKIILKSCSEFIPQVHFFSLLPWLPKRPKRPKQKNSCSKMWSIDQLYIELGI
jgi:hypothetical protein